MLSAVNAIAVNEAFWTKVYADNFRRLCARASRVLTSGDSSEAEDAVSEAFFRAMRYVRNPEEIGNIGSYLWTAVKRVWTSQQSRLNESRTDRLDDLSADEIDSLAAVQVEPKIQAMLEQEEALAQFRLKLGPISLEEATTIEMRRQGYSFEEIAAELGEDIKLVRMRWARFTTRQRKRLTTQTVAPA